MERLSPATINCGSRVLLQLSLFPTQNRLNRKKNRSQPKFMNQIPILLFLCILISSFYQIYSYPEIPNFSGKHNLTSPLLSSLSIRKNASSKALNKTSTSSPSPISPHRKVTASSIEPSEVKEHHSSSHSPLSSSDVHKNAQEKSSKRTEHSTYSNKHLDRSESTKNNPNATVRGIREAGVEEKVEEAGAGETETVESSPNSPTEVQSTTSSPTTGESGQSTTGGTSPAGDGKETSKEGSDSTGSSSESSGETSPHTTGQPTTGGTSSGSSGETSPAGEEPKKTEETSKSSEKTTVPATTHTTTHKPKHGEKSSTPSHDGHDGNDGHDGHHSTPSHPKHTTKKGPEKHHKSKEKRDNNTDTTWSPKYLKHTLVPKDEYILSAELKTDKFDIHDWANKSGKLFERTVIHSAASNLKLDTKNLQMMLVYPTPSIYADKTIIRFSLKTNHGYVSGSEMDKFKNALQNALHEQLHIESITLSSGTSNSQKPFFQSGIYSLLILSMLGACLTLILVMLIILIVILGHRTKASSKPNKRSISN
ncbi:uncharacterized protein LOC141855244 isoform X2 [Brevipalpus obovatus]|uniref:uncharacterized protein LOC141855244 isoform X2 n=1 Tax=Brevipalpus obovatus TaxID=246614 RepID=UPI003D9F7B09